MSRYLQNQLQTAPIPLHRWTHWIGGICYEVHPHVHIESSLEQAPRHCIDCSMDKYRDRLHYTSSLMDLVSISREKLGMPLQTDTQYVTQQILITSFTDLLYYTLTRHGDTMATNTPKREGERTVLSGKEEYIPTIQWPQNCLQNMWK